jgi:hypothetical protein
MFLIQFRFQIQNSDQIAKNEESAQLIYFENLNSALIYIVRRVDIY